MVDKYFITVCCKDRTTVEEVVSAIRHDCAAKQIYITTYFNPFGITKLFHDNTYRKRIKFKTLEEYNKVKEIIVEHKLTTDIVFNYHIQDGDTTGDEHESIPR